MEEINRPGTEQGNKKTKDLDLMSAGEIIRIMNDEDLNTVAAVKAALPQIEKVIEVIVATLSKNGRIVYAGAGTSGRLAVLDAVECGPTFGCTTEFTGLLAGGYDAMVHAAESAEDDRDACAEELKKIGFSEDDMLIGVAASGRTPYVLGGIEYAKKMGAVTACVCCNTGTEIGALVDYPIEVWAGPEILAGSTRLKSGTCQKMILNMLSTASMICTGKVYKNLMVGIRATNHKLEERSRRIVMEAAGCDYETADQALIETGNECREAIVMILLGTDLRTAKEKIDAAGGRIRKAVENRQ